MFTIRQIPCTATHHTYVVLIPLYRFGLDVDQANLSEWDSLERYSPESFLPLLQDWQEFRDFLGVFPPDYILRVCFSDQNEFLIFNPREDPSSGYDLWLRGDPEGEIKLWIDDLLIAFRLFKDGLFSHAGQWCIATGTLTCGGHQTKVAATSGWINSADTTARSLTKSTGQPCCYYLDSTEIKKFCEFRDRIEDELAQIRIVPRMRVALDHLMSSYDVRQPTTHVVDLFICLEALLKYSRNESSTRLNHRVANLLGNNASQRKEIFERVKLFYELRCNIVHGEALLAQQEQLLDRVSELRELVRNVFLIATALGGKVGFGPEYYKTADDLARDVSLKKKVIQDAFRAAAVTQ